MCKVCGGDDKLCGGGDDLTPGEIGFAATCPAVTPVAGAGMSCASTIVTLGDLVECVVCVTEFKADCMDRAQLPSVVSYPIDCSP
jgi:hypothetical protein